MSNCAESALKTLDREVLVAAKSLFDAAKAALQVIKVQKEAMSLSLKITLVPLQLKKGALDAIVSEVRNVARIIPESVTALCPDLGNINVMLQKSISGQFEGALTAVAEIDRQLSLAAENDAEIADIGNSITFFSDMSSTIDTVLSKLDT